MACPAGRRADTGLEGRGRGGGRRPAGGPEGLPARLLLPDGPDPGAPVRAEGGVWLEHYAHHRGGRAPAEFAGYEEARAWKRRLHENLFDALCRDILRRPVARLGRRPRLRLPLSRCAHPPRQAGQRDPLLRPIIGGSVNEVGPVFAGLSAENRLVVRHARIFRIDACRDRFGTARLGQWKPPARRGLPNRDADLERRSRVRPGVFVRLVVPAPRREPGGPGPAS